MSDEIISFVVERIADLVAEEVNLLRGAKNEFLSLQRELQMMQSFLIDADAKLEAGDLRLRTSVEQIREMAYDAEDLIDSFLDKDVDRKEKAKVSFLKKMMSFCSCLVQTHQMGNEVEQLMKRIKETTERLQTYQVQTNAQVIKLDRPQSYPHSISDDNVVGFDSDVKVLVERLINRDEKILAIAGMGGSGKTTMARKIYNHAHICHHFKSKAWVCVSQSWNHESLLKEILRQTTGQSGEGMTPQIIVQEIHKLLLGKSYLIVLDDVWEQEALTKIMVPTTLHGSKFLVTTRKTEVIQFSDLGCYVHKPKRLTDDESWDLFQKIALERQTNAIIEPFVLLGQEMLKRCDGLPLAVVALAGLLSMKSSIEEWERVKNNVSSKIIEDKGGLSEYGRVEDMLALSYSDLNHILKSCFMYLGLFPEDEEIETTELMQCWIAEGFFKSVKSEESVEDVAKNHLGELIQRCLVNYDEIAEDIKVHDLMRDLAIKRAKEKNFLDIIPSSSWTNDQPSTAAGTRTLKQQPPRLGIIDSKLEDKLEDILEGGNVYNVSPRLRSFICYSKYSTSVVLKMSLKNMLTKYPLLTVLVLTMFSNIETRIPDEIGKLIHLRHFHISFSDSHTIHLPNSIKNLRNLLSFYIDAGQVEPIPNIKQMKQLRYLCMPLGNGEESLNLQDLRNIKVLWDIRGGGWMLREVKHLSPTVEKLGIREITGCEQLDAIYESPSIVQGRLYSLLLSFKRCEFQVQKLQHCNNLKRLYLDGVIAAAKGVTLAFPPHLLVLRLWISEIKEHDTLLDALVRLPYLKLLCLGNRSYLGSQLNFPANTMLHLQELYLYNLTNLEEIHVKEGAMPLLKYLDTFGCQKLTVIPQRLRLCRRYWNE